MSERTQKQKGVTPTIVHVARLAGVGVGTVSRVLNSESSVSKKALERVQAAMKQLQFRPNASARNLRGGKSRAIGIVIPDLGDPFMSTCVHGAHTVLRQSGYMSMLTFSSGSAEKEAQEIEYLLRRQIDGLILVPANGSPQWSEQLIGDVPVAVFDVPMKGGSADTILVKNRQGARQVVEHLLSHGHTNILALGVNPNLYTIQQRVTGYREAMKQAGLPNEVLMIDAEDPEATDLLRTVMARQLKPTAIFTLNGFTSIHVLKAVKKLKLRIPADIAVAGFDDLQLADVFDPPLTVVRQPATAIGENAARLLLERITGERQGVQRLVLPVELLIRRSCGCKPESSS